MALTTFQATHFKKNYQALGFEILLENEDFKVTLHKGDTDEVCFSFLGVGEGMGGLSLQKEEFFGSVQAGKSRSVIFIFDKKRGWFSDEQKNAELFNLLAQHCEEFGYKTRYAIGNSMGGFGALIATRYIDFDAVIAFCPQFSVDPVLVPEETRWLEWTKSIKKFDVRSVADGKFDRGNFYILHGLDGEDQHQYSRFPFHANIHHYLAAGSSHHAAKDLKKKGLLRPFVEACFMQGPMQVDELMRENGISKRIKPTVLGKLMTWVRKKTAA
ncbi:MAG: hypothetical protein COB37_04305 [Kordiimonadales bacterium]|nr:MAG: hypothetical protein COB37_04305 [Kordiimonadales bacterium]